jgi:UDP-3-O-[3-hydroxymyristoyl] glucosamine N-acyltransferase
MISGPSRKTVAELAAICGGRVVGDGVVLIKSVASLESAEEGDIAFLDDLRLLDAAKKSRASCLIAPEGAGISGCVIESPRPKLAFALVAEILHPRDRREAFIHPTATLAGSSSIGEDCFIGPYVQVGETASIGRGTQILSGVVIGNEVKIGNDCVLYPNVVLYDGVTVGDRVVLHAGVCIGADGFGYVRDENAYHKFPQIGTAIIEDDVEIGAYSCVDRGALGQTRIGRGTKIDNLVQIAHNVDIGERVVIAAQTGISGSTVIEDDAVIGGQVGMGDHARVQSGAIIGSKAGILPGKIVRAGVWWGIPVQPLNQYKRLNAHLSRVPQMREEIKALKERIAELEKAVNPESKS